MAVVFVTFGKVWLPSSLFENFTLYLINFDLDISSKALKPSNFCNKGLPGSNCLELAFRKRTLCDYDGNNRNLSNWLQDLFDISIFLTGEQIVYY